MALDSTQSIESVQRLLTTASPGTLPKPTPHQLTESQTKILNDLIAHFSSPNLKLPVQLPINSATEETKKPLTDWEKCSLFSREALVRYLKADKWDAERSIKRAEETVVWRRECGTDKMELGDEQAQAVRTEVGSPFP